MLRALQYFHRPARVCHRMERIRNSLPKFTRSFSHTDDPELKQLAKHSEGSSEPIFRTHIEPIKYIPLMNHIQLFAGQSLIMLPRELPRVIFVYYP